MAVDYDAMEITMTVGVTQDAAGVLKNESNLLLQQAAKLLKPMTKSLTTT